MEIEDLLVRLMALWLNFEPMTLVVGLGHLADFALADPVFASGLVEFPRPIRSLCYQKHCRAAAAPLRRFHSAILNSVSRL